LTGAGSAAATATVATRVAAKLTNRTVDMIRSGERACLRQGPGEALRPFLFGRPFRSLSRVCRAPTIFRTFPMPATDTAVERAYQLARERYESLGVDVGAVLETLAR